MFAVNVMNMMPMEIDRVACSQADKATANIHESTTDISSPGHYPFSLLLLLVSSCRNIACAIQCLQFFVT